MHQPFIYQFPPWLVAVVTFVVILIFNWLGYQWKSSLLKKEGDPSSVELGTIQGSLLGLMALLLAFTFGMAASKFDHHREIIIEEANDIGTAILRTDLYTDSNRNQFHADFREYIEERDRYYFSTAEEEIQASLDKSEVISGRIWKKTADLSRNLDNRVMSGQMIPALNNMIDVVTTREAMRKAKVPPVIVWVLLLLISMAGFLTGYDHKGKGRIRFMVFGFAFMISLTLYLVLELASPRKGMLNLNKYQQEITNLKHLVTPAQ